MSLYDSKDRISYKLLTSDRIKDALVLQADTMKQECVAIGVGMFEVPGAAEEMQLVFREVIRDGVTVMAVDMDTNEMAAVAFNKIHVRLRDGEKDELGTFMEENLKHQPCQELVKFLGKVESTVDVFNHYQVDCALELFYLGTSPRYQGRGIGRRIVQECIHLARSLQPPIVPMNPQVIFGVFASTFSQRIVERLNFDVLADVCYADFVCRGRKMSDRIGSAHEMARLAAFKL